METPAIIAVGSTRKPKVDAVTSAVEAYARSRGGPGGFRVIGCDVPSRVSHTPVGRQELMAGARGRAEALAPLAKARGETWRYFVGVEGGLDVLQNEGGRLALLQSWVYVCDGAGRSAYGHSAGVLLPEPLAVQVLDRGVELSAAIDEYAGIARIRDGQGAVGVLTNQLITREDAFRSAAIAAFAPFFNSGMYR